MAVLTPLDDRDVERVCEAHGLAGPRRLEGLAAGSVNSNFALEVGESRFFLRLYEERDPAGAEREAALLGRLAAAGVATPPPRLRPDGRAVTVVREKAAVIFPWIAGDIRCQASVSAADARTVGAALARVHLAAAGEAAEPGRFEAPDLAARLDRIAQGGDPVHAPAVPARRAQLAAAQASRDPSLPRGLIHGDLFRDNVLWAGADLAALLDFDSACDGPYAYDLMVTVLSWCFGDDLDARLARAMREGYETVRPLTPAERAGLHAEARFAALRFLVTRTTDYALRTGTTGPRVVKDWRRFERRLATLDAMGAAGLAAMLG